MVKFCPYCRNDLKGNFKFCPTCGKQMPEIEKVKKAEEINTPKKVETKEKVETKKEVKTKDREKSKFALPKILLNIPRKTAFIIIAIICLVVVVSAAVWVLSPFDGMTSSVNTYGGRTFTVTVENTFGSDVECRLLVSNILYGEPFNLNSIDNTKTINVIEDEAHLSFPSNEYRITLKVIANSVIEEATADAVTESATFLISDNNGYHSVECTGYQ